MRLLTRWNPGAGRLEWGACRKGVAPPAVSHYLPTGRAEKVAVLHTVSTSLSLRALAKRAGVGQHPLHQNTGWEGLRAGASGMGAVLSRWEGPSRRGLPVREEPEVESGSFVIRTVHRAGGCI